MTTSICSVGSQSEMKLLTPLPPQGARELVASVCYAPLSTSVCYALFYQSIIYVVPIRSHILCRTPLPSFYHSADSHSYGEKIFTHHYHVTDLQPPTSRTYGVPSASIVPPTLLLPPHPTVIRRHNLNCYRLILSARFDTSSTSDPKSLILVPPNGQSTNNGHRTEPNSRNEPNLRTEPNFPTRP